jgi:hypothetical protein
MTKPRGRAFPPGNTLGRGRPPGSRNKEKSRGQHLLDQYTPHLTGKCIELAMQGNLGALRLCMERISPARRDAYIRMSLPPVRTAQDVDLASEKVTQAIRRGKITPDDGGKMMSILGSRLRVIESVQHESRLEKLEAAANLRPAA